MGQKNSSVQYSSDFERILTDISVSKMQLLCKVKELEIRITELEKRVTEQENTLKQNNDTVFPDYFPYTSTQKKTCKETHYLVQ